ncbi:uncharacterized protein, partial [Parasteatoda tepidariorum]|uniref:uncharacterized protein n=1 Tax=Parasteatoda tepidariorum TaxID=114398 RepID=UPI0039BCA5D8
MEARNSKFDDQKTLEFVQFYEKEEVLWNVRHEEYKNKDARDSAFLRIAKAMNMPRVGPADVNNKINSIRTAFKQELQKIKESKGTGAAAEVVYIPKISWFDAANRFLPSVIKKRKSFSNL